MSEIEKNRRKYALISHQMREKLITMVDNDRYSIRGAAQTLKIKYSTAKMIVSKYKKQGKITKLKNQIKININPTQQSNSINSMTDSNPIKTPPPINNNNMFQIYEMNLSTFSDPNIQLNFFPYILPCNYYNEYPIEFYYFYQ